MPFPSTEELTLPASTSDAPHTGLWVGVGIAVGLLLGAGILVAAFAVS